MGRASTRPALINATATLAINSQILAYVLVSIFSYPYKLSKRILAFQTKQSSFSWYWNYRLFLWRFIFASVQNLWSEVCSHIHDSYWKPYHYLSYINSDWFIWKDSLLLAVCGWYFGAFWSLILMVAQHLGGNTETFKVWNRLD